MGPCRTRIFGHLFRKFPRLSLRKYLAIFFCYFHIYDNKLNFPEQDVNNIFFAIYSLFNFLFMNDNTLKIKVNKISWVQE